MSNHDNASSYNCWQKLFHFSKKADQENDKNMKQIEEIFMSKGKSVEEIISTTTNGTASKLSQTNNIKNYGIDFNVEKKVSCKNSINKDEHFKILRQDYGVYSNTNLHKREKTKSNNFDKGDFRKQFKYPKVYALYKTVSGLRICLREKCKNSSKFHNDSDSKCICPHCGAMAVVNESLKHPVTFDYTVVDHPSNNHHKEKNRKHVHGINSLSRHPSFINVVTKLKAMENRIAQLELMVSRNEHNTETEVKRSRQFVKRFPMPISELRSEKYRRQKQLEALNVNSEKDKNSLPQNKTSQITQTDDYIKETNSKVTVKSGKTHSKIQSETLKEKPAANFSKCLDSNSEKKNVPERNKIETVRANIDIENKFEFETKGQKYKQNKTDHVERSTATDSNRKSTYSIASDSKSCWSNFKSKFVHSDNPNEKNKIVQIFKSKRTVSEVSSQKSGKNMTGKLRSVTNSDRYSTFNSSYQNMMCQTYNKICHDINGESINSSKLENTPELKPSEISSSIKKVKTHPPTNINYKELLNATAKKPLELNKLVTLSHEEKTQLLLEKMQNLEDISKKMNMMQYHYGEVK